MRRAAVLLLLLLLAAGAAPDAELGRLLEALRTAPDEDAARTLEGRVRRLWDRAGSPAAGLLMERGLYNMDADAHREAVEDFDAVLALEPELATAWQRRAAARFALGDLDGAMADAAETLRRDPRHFPALGLLSRVAEARGDWRGALAAWRQMLAIDPKQPEAAARLNLLRRNAEGEAS